MVPLTGRSLASCDYEAHHVFDIWYCYTSEINPTAITSDMRRINKANFASCTYLAYALNLILQT